MPSREKWNQRYAARGLVWSAGPNQLLAEVTAELNPGAALDIACGEGRNALWLAERGWTVTAMDFSEVAISKARQIAERRNVNVNWQVEDVSACQLPEGEFDLVVITYLHTSPAERTRWLANAAAAVKPAGRFIYIGHDPSNIEHGVGGPQDPAVLPDAQVISATLTGFRVDVAEVVERPVTNEPGHKATLSGNALDTLVIACRQ